MVMGVSEPEGLSEHELLILASLANGANYLGLSISYAGMAAISVIYGAFIRPEGRNGLSSDMAS